MTKSNSKTPTIISIEMNELNFEDVNRYAEAGDLPTFARMLNQYGYRITQSEKQYNHLEPWIQWVTVHTGKTFKEHGIFRLGDIKNLKVEQIWEHLEARGISSAAVSPMNAENRLKESPYFIPDPWTKTKVTGGTLIENFYNAVAQAVGDNANQKIEKKSLIYLIVGAIRYALPSNYPRYLSLVKQARSKKWSKALFLDLLLADLFCNLQRNNPAHYTTLFLNSAAHVQHHYLYSSRYYRDGARNPEWYVAQNIDPVLEVYQLYDHILAQVCNQFPNARIQILTGLHQTPHKRTTYYWRLKNHHNFLQNLGIPFEDIEPRMSRDFLVKCENETQATEVARRLSALSADDQPIFRTDQRQLDVFVELIYDNEIKDGFEYQFEGDHRRDLFENVAFVAIKNGEHSGEGYYMDTESPAQKGKEEIQLTELFDINSNAFKANSV